MKNEEINQLANAKEEDVAAKPNTLSSLYGKNKKCIFFVDDLNMPTMDKYDTQSAIMLLLQIQAYGQIYDRERLEEKKELQDIQFVSCMNPKAGSFMVNNRLQRYYTVVTTFLPTPESIKAIYGELLLIRDLYSCCIGA